MFADDKMLYMKESKHSTKKLLDFIYLVSKIRGCQINIQKATVFLYANNEYRGRERNQERSHSQ